MGPRHHPEWRDRVAILAPDRAPLTYGRLDAHVEEIGERLCELGVSRRDRVACVLPDGPDSATAAIAISSWAAFAPLTPRARRVECESIFLELTPKIVLIAPGMPQEARDAARALRIPVLEVHRHYEAGVFTLDGRSGYRPARNVNAAPEDIALILCASSKLAPLTHGNMSAAVESIASFLALNERDRCMNLASLFEWRGLFEGLWAPLATGGSMIAASGFDELREFQPTWCCGAEERRTPRLYGIPEAPAIAFDGRPMGTGISVVDGEILVRGPAVIRAYFRNEAANRDAFRDGWLRTGDCGFIDADGSLVVTGRSREFIHRGDLKISPVEIDEVLLSHPAIAEAVTFPIPDAESGEEIAAAVVLLRGATLTTAALRAFAATHLAAHKLPRRILFVDRVPKVGRFRMAGAFGLNHRPKRSEPASVFLIQPGSSGIPLFVIAPRETESRKLAELLGPGRRVLGVRLPDYLPRPRTIEHMAAECARAIRRFQPEGPYALSGWHAEGIIALETARQLEEAGAEIALVAIFDGHAPRVSGTRQFLIRDVQFALRASRCGNFVTEALRHYRPYPWSGRAVHLQYQEIGILAGELDRVAPRGSAAR